jgi:uncharacterized tellurite resistance protein B-like protein
MGLISIMDLLERKKRESHIRNLLEIALADGTFDEEEILLISDIASNYDISREEVDRIRNNPDSISFTPPSSMKARLLQMYDLVELMLADQHIHDKELILCHEFAAKLGVEEDVVDEMIELLSNIQTKGKDKYQQIITFIEKFQ